MGRAVEELPSLRAGPVTFFGFLVQIVAQKLQNSTRPLSRYPLWDAHLEQVFSHKQALGEEDTEE